MATPEPTVRSKRWFLCLSLRVIRGSCDRELAFPAGRGRIYLDPQKDADFEVIREIFVDRRYPSDYEGSIVVDLGAHEGWAMAYAPSKGAAVVVAFEPEFANLDVLVRAAATLDASGDRGVPSWKAIAADDGERVLHVTTSSWSHSLLHRSDRSVVEERRVSTWSLGRAISEARTRAGPSHRLIVKMDVEGGEGEILLAAPRESLREIDEMFVDVHRWGSHAYDEITARLRGAGLNRTGGSTSRFVHVKRM